MIKHKPKPTTNVKIGDKIYKCNGLGVVYLPERYERFNPLDKKVSIKKDNKQA